MIKKCSKNEYTTGCCGVNIVSFRQSKKGKEGNIYINTYSKLSGGSEGFYIKGYGVNKDSRLSGSFNSLKFKDRIEYYYRRILDHRKIKIRDVSHIRIILPFINAIIVNSYLEGMNTFFRIILYDLNMSQIFHSDSSWSLDLGSFIKTEKTSF